MSRVPFPSFDELPLDKQGPAGNAWGLWGKDDELGMLNLLTESNTIEAAKEIREGRRFHLDWEISKPSHPVFGRQKFEHRLKPITGHIVANDDVLHFNTQCSSQWDGFRHYPYQRSKSFYNGHKQVEFETSTELGIDTWVKRGGIVGRGVLLDYASWAAENNIDSDPFQSNPIKLEHLKAIVAEQGIKFRVGDLLFIRCGFTAKYNQLSAKEEEEFANQQPIGLLGLEATRDSLRWLWDNHFAAVASDSPGFERIHTLDNFDDPDVTIHQWILSGWGVPIGEMFNLEEVAEHCRKTGRHSFFVSSVPLHVPGGVASPPNAIAIF